MAACEYRDVVLKVEDLTVAYGDKTILKGVNAEIRDVVGHGQIVGVLGPSGVGKTTLMRALAGLEPPKKGVISVYHEGDKAIRPVQRGMVGVVGQQYPLLRHRTILGNLMVAARMRKHSEEADRDRCMKYLQRFGLEKHAGMYPIQLSGGQRQRVAIIQQLIRSEHFILMDEPFTGLDPIMKSEVCRLIREVADVNELNTIIVVTHGIPEALCVSDTLWMMGRDRDKGGEVISGAYIKKTYDLAERGIAWNKEYIRAPGYGGLLQEIEAEFYNL